MMTHFNQLCRKVRFITLVVICLECITLNIARPCAMDNRVAEESLEWIDDKGYLKFHEDKSKPDNCESCSELARIKTDGSEICYTTEPDENDNGISICGWNVAEEHNFDIISFRKFPSINGLKVLSVTKYKISQWLNIDQTFVDLHDLEYLYLESNHITSWSISELENPLTKLRVLSLANNPITHLSEKSFSWLEGSRLEYLNMRGCSKIQILSSAVFKPLEKSVNLWLDLSYTIIEQDQLSNLFDGFKAKKDSGKNFGLKVLSLAHAGLYKIPTQALENVAHSLKKLSLQGNYFSNCWNVFDSEEDGGDCFLPEMRILEEINFKDSSLIDFPFATMLSATPNLQKIYLDENPLREISCNETSNVSYISLRNVKNDRGLKLCTGNKCVFPKLETLDLSNTLLNTTESSFHGLSNLKNLSLCNTGIRYIEGLLDPLKNLEFLDLGNNNNMNLTNTAFKELSNLKALNLQSCSLQVKSISPFEDLKNLEDLDMSKNSIRNLDESQFIHNIKLKKLILQDNRIAAWKNRIFNKTLQNLHTLNLRNNWINDVTVAMEDDFRNIPNLDMSLNPLSCCGFRVVEFFGNCIMQEKTFDKTCKIEVLNITLKSWGEPNAYMCVTEENEQKLLTEIGSKDCLENEDMTPTTTTIISTSSITSTTTTASTATSVIPNDSDETITYIIIAIIIIIPIGGALCYWKRWNIRFCACLFRRSMALSLLKDTKTKVKRKEGYQYDVFLSYSDRDREWILQQLIPNIEERCNIKVCLHERDFQAGLPVLENIIACMDRSRCVLLVLSEAFLHSHWCQFELNLAQHRLLEMQHDRLILVLLENIPRDKSSKMLRYLMLSKTYLVWPVKGDEEEKSLFWRKLKKAVGPVHDTVNVSFV